MGKRYYDNYDYEEAYKEQCKKLEEAEMERWMKEGWVNCLYRTSTYKSTNTESNTTLLESMVYPSFKFKADMPKTEKKRETSPSQSNLNDKNARRYLIRLANINFGKGDIWATFGWNNGLLPETYEDAKKDVVNFIRRINRKRKKLGLENAKYIYIIAFEEYTRPHFHFSSCSVCSCFIFRLFFPVFAVMPHAIYLVLIFVVFLAYTRSVVPGINTPFAIIRVRGE